MSFNHDYNCQSDLTGIFETQDYPAPITFDYNGFDSQGVKIVDLVSSRVPPLLQGKDDPMPFDNNIILDIPGYGPCQIFLCATDRGIVTRTQLAVQICRNISAVFTDENGAINPHIRLIGIYYLRGIWKAKVVEPLAEEPRKLVTEECQAIISFNIEGKSNGIRVSDIWEVVNSGHLEKSHIGLYGSSTKSKRAMISLCIPGYDEMKHYVHIPISHTDLALEINHLIFRVLRPKGKERDAKNLFLMSISLPLSGKTWNVEVVRR